MISHDLGSLWNDFPRLENEEGRFAIYRQNESLFSKLSKCKDIIHDIIHILKYSNKNISFEDNII